MSSVRRQATSVRPIRLALIVALLTPLMAGAEVASSLLLDLDFETGTINSGNPRVYKPGASAADAATITADRVRYGNYAVAHKTVVGDPAYIYSGLRSESSTSLGSPNDATVPAFRSYQFSFSLRDWQDWDGSYSDQIRDVIWQFKRDQGSPAEGYFSVRGNHLDFDQPNVGRKTVVADLRDYDNEWIDVRIDVNWAADATGRYVVGVRLPGEADYATVVDKSGIVTWRSGAGGGPNGKVQWGDFRPNSTVENRAPTTRIVLHDNIRISTERLPPPTMQAR